MTTEITITVIPSYNEEHTIVGIAKHAKRYCDDVIVIDDGSKDKTTKVVCNSGLKCITSIKNYGVGNATRIGFEAGREFQANIITLDGDGQHDPAEIPVVLAPIKANQADVVIGSRFLTGAFGNQKRYRRFGIAVITWLYNFGHKHKITDAQCGFRAYSAKAVKMLDIAEDGFSYSTEVLIKARAMGLKIVEVPVSCIYHQDRKQDSTLHPLGHGIRVALDTIKWRLRLWN